LLLADRHDLEDLVRSVLPLQFEDFYQESRTPRYAEQAQLDFLIKRQGLALTLKLAGTGWHEAGLLEELAEDARYYERRPHCHKLVVLVYDAQGVILDRDGRQNAWSRSHGDLDVCCVIV
jgi:hypothetical protein